MASGARFRRTRAWPRLLSASGSSGRAATAASNAITADAKSSVRKDSAPRRAKSPAVTGTKLGSRCSTAGRSVVTDSAAAARVRPLSLCGVGDGPLARASTERRPRRRCQRLPRWERPRQFVATRPPPLSPRQTPRRLTATGTADTFASRDDSSRRRRRRCAARASTDVAPRQNPHADMTHAVVEVVGITEHLDLSAGAERQVLIDDERRGGAACARKRADLG